MTFEGCNMSRDRTATLIRLGLVLALAFVVHALMPLAPAKAAVRLLPPGEIMKVPGEEPYIPPQEAPKEEPKPPSQLEKVRIAVADGDAGKLEGLVARNAPYEIVAPSAKPDLVWDPKTRNVNAGSAVVSYDVGVADLGAVIDRTAVVNALTQRAASRRQSIRFDTANRLYHKGEAIQVLVDGVVGRALLLVDIAGDGQTQLIFPGVADTPIPAASPYSLGLTVGQPFGTDVMVAITSAQPIAALEQRMKEARPTDAPEFLALLDKNMPQDARIGLLTLSSAP